MKKSFWKSKTLWANAIALIALGVQTQTGFMIPETYQLAILGVVNMVLRIVTKAELE